MILNLYKYNSHYFNKKNWFYFRQVLRKLYENKKVANATHNISAYRFMNSTNDHIVQDCDDDGETHAGGRLLHLLQVKNIKN